jgi:ribosomal protein S27AE
MNTAEPTTYEVVEFYYNQDEAVTVLRSFTDKAEAQAFAVAHYETKMDNSEDCTCTECAEGWKIHPQNFKSYTVEVWEADKVTATNDTCPDCGEAVIYDHAREWWNHVDSSSRCFYATV